MKKRMLIMLIFLIILFGAVFLIKMYKMWRGYQALEAMAPKGITVSTMQVALLPWQSQVKAVGSLRAVTGVNVTTELQGMVKDIYFQPGSLVTKGTVLVQLHASTEENQLKALEAQMQLAKVTYNRDKAQFAINAVSAQTVDVDLWNLKNLEAQVSVQRAILNKKTIRAPFTGRLGISNVNPGQYINVGDKITSLQALNPIYVDFNLPQQNIAEIKVGDKIKVTADAFPQLVIEGKVTTIEPVVDINTRNVVVEAEIDNHDMKLLPGMFVHVDVTTGKPNHFLTLPQTAISFNPYGEIAYVVKEKKETKEFYVKQVFVTTGKTRGDQIQILSGLKKGDVVVTSGQLKLKNDATVIINNQVQPLNQVKPKVSNYK